MNKKRCVNKYSKLFADTMRQYNRNDTEKLYDEFKTRYLAHLNSKKFKEFSKYKTMRLEKVYCAITFAQICTELGYSLDEAQKIWEETLTKKVKKLANNLCKFVDNLPNSYKIITSLLYKESQNRISENCLTFEVLKCNKEKLEYKISRCAYVEIFEYYGIKKFCKVFCNNDLCMNAFNKRAKFIRYSDLVDGNCCHDEIVNVKYKNN